MSSSFLGVEMRSLPTKIFAALATALLAIASTPAIAFAGDRDDAILAELNFAREHPQEYARMLQFQTVSDAEPVDRSDPNALAEAIDFLMHQRPLEPLRADSRLSAAALDHVSDQGPRGDIGHGPFSKRLQRRGVLAMVEGEDIDYGQKTPREIVRRFIIDSGVPDRGHRMNIFVEDFQVAGVSCGFHRVYAEMCVVDFAGGLVGAE
jgi:uncharacterized protein YkwD